MNEEGAQCEITEGWTGIYLGMGAWMEMSSVFLKTIEVMEADVKVEKRRG